MALCDNRMKHTQLNVDNFFNRSSTRRFTVRGFLGILRRFKWRCWVCLGLDQAKVGEEEQPAPKGHVEKLVAMVVRLRLVCKTQEEYQGAMLMVVAEDMNKSPILGRHRWFCDRQVRQWSPSPSIAMKDHPRMQWNVFRQTVFGTYCHDQWPKPPIFWCKVPDVMWCENNDWAFMRELL